MSLLLRLVTGALVGVAVFCVLIAAILFLAWFATTAGPLIFGALFCAGIGAAIALEEEL